MTLLAQVATAAAATPVFGGGALAAKVFEGRPRAPGGNCVATDGKAFFIPFAQTFQSPTDGSWWESIRVSWSPDYGATWGGSVVVVTAPAGLPGVQSVATSPGPSGTTNLHLAWEQYDDPTVSSAASVYYAAGTFTPGDVPRFDAPVKVSGDVPVMASWAGTSIDAAADGTVFITFRGTDGLLHSTTGTPAGFSFPDTLPTTATTLVADWGDVEMKIDSAKTMHLAYPSTDGGGVKFGAAYVKKPFGGGWSAPAAVAPVAAVNRCGALQNEPCGAPFTTIAVLDANRVYVGTQNGATADVYRSSNGGRTWVKSTVAQRTATQTLGRHYSLAVNRSGQLYFAGSFDVTNATTGVTLEESRVFKSTDGGATWGTPAVLPNVCSASVKTDANGKAGVSLYGTNAFGHDGVNQTGYFAKEK